MLFLASCGNESDSDKAADPPVADASEGSADESTEESVPETPESADAGSCAYAPDGTTPPKTVDPPSAEPAKAQKVPLVLKTSVGDLNLTLDAVKTPCTVNSFTALAEQGYFDKTQCHRLVTEGIWVLQCGDPTGSGAGGPGYAFADELSGSETYPAGTVAMANAGPGTNGSQFFLVYKDSLGLPPNYTVFGKFDAASIRIVQKVAKAGTVEGGPDGSPKKPVEIQSVTVR